MNQKQVKDIEISPEYLDKIRSFTAIVPEKEYPYIPKAFRDLPEEKQPIFTIRAITGEESLRFSDQMRGEVELSDGKAQVKVKQGSYTISVVKSCLIRWDNYQDINGNIIPYDGHIRNIPRALLEELRDEMTERSKLTDEEVLGLK